MAATIRTFEATVERMSRLADAASGARRYTLVVTGDPTVEAAVSTVMEDAGQYATKPTLALIGARVQLTIDDAGTVVELERLREFEPRRTGRYRAKFVVEAGAADLTLFAVTAINDRLVDARIHERAGSRWVRGDGEPGRYVNHPDVRHETLTADLDGILDEVGFRRIAGAEYDASEVYPGKHEVIARVRPTTLIEVRQGATVEARLAPQEFGPWWLRTHSFTVDHGETHEGYSHREVEPSGWEIELAGLPVREDVSS